jgi:hypothetical protein
LYIWEKYRTFEITFGIILKMNLPLYKGFTLEINNTWWPLTTLNRWPLYRIKIYSKMHRESSKVIVMTRWPLYKGDRYDRFDCTSIEEEQTTQWPKEKSTKGQTSIYKTSVKSFANIDRPNRSMFVFFKKWRLWAGSRID